MKMSLTKDEMLVLWRNLRMAEPLRLDCAVARTDGTDQTAALEAEMRAWYLNLLSKGDARLIVAVDVAPTALVSTSAEGLTRITASASSRRILSVEFEGWGAPVAANSDFRRVCRAAANPYCTEPLAAATGPDSLVVAGACGALKALNVALDPGPDSYIFDEGALALISGLQ